MGVTRETRVSSYLKDTGNHPAAGLNVRSEGKGKSQEDPPRFGALQSEGQSCHLPRWASLAGQVWKERPRVQL